MLTGIKSPPEFHGG